MVLQLTCVNPSSSVREAVVFRNKEREREGERERERERERQTEAERERAGENTMTHVERVR